MTAIETQPSRSASNSNPDPYTGLSILIGKSVFDRAIRKFENHFSSAVADFKKGRKGPIQRQVWKEFRDAVPNTVAGTDRAFLGMLAEKFARPDGSVPDFVFRQNRDILFVCIENQDNRQIFVVYPAKVDPHTGRPVLESRHPTKFTNGNAR